MFIQIFTRTREIYISHSRRENIPCRVGRRRRGGRGERRTDLARRWSALDSLGTKRSWNVLWKLLWKALRGTDRTGAPDSRFCYTRAATTTRRPPSFPPGTPRGPTCAHVLPPLCLSLFARTSHGFLYRSSKVPRFSSRSSYPLILCSSIASFSFFFLSRFFLVRFILLGRTSCTVFSSIETFSR